MSEEEIRRDERKRMEASNRNLHRRLQLIEGYWLQKLDSVRISYRWWRDEKTADQEARDMQLRRDGFEAALDLMNAQTGDHWWYRGRIEQLRAMPEWWKVDAAIVALPEPPMPKSTRPAVTRRKEAP